MIKKAMHIVSTLTLSTSLNVPMDLLGQAESTQSLPVPAQTNVIDAPGVKQKQPAALTAHVPSDAPPAHTIHAPEKNDRQYQYY